MVNKKRLVVFGGLAVISIVFSLFGSVHSQERTERLKKILERRNDSKTRGNLIAGEIMVDGRKRSYLVHLPKRNENTRRLPMVFAFHGGGGNAQNMVQMSGFNEKADKENFVVVYPNGTGRNERIFLTFNAGGCCDYAMEENVDDVKFVKMLIDKMVSEYSVDEKRIYSTGFSNGALISYRLGAELTDKFAAIAPVAGALFASSPAPKGKLPVLIIHGLADTAVPIEGGDSQRERIRTRQSEPYKSLQYASDYWAKNNGCTLDPVRTQTGKIIRENYQKCNARNDVEVIKIIDGTHSWAGGKKGREAADEPSKAISTTDAIWEFFKKHQRK